MTMNFERSYIEQINLSKRIPLHYQKRYLSNFSNGSFNATFLSGIYKNKIKTLQKNNKMLALALEKDRAKKEELLEESKANANLIMFSKLKLAGMSENLKNIVSVLDETVALLQKHSTASLSKLTPRNTTNREEFKEQVKDVVMDIIPEETSHSTEELKSKATNEDNLKPHNKNIDGSSINILNEKKPRHLKRKNSYVKSIPEEIIDSEITNSSFEKRLVNSKINQKNPIKKTSNLSGKLLENQVTPKKFKSKAPKKAKKISNLMKGTLKQNENKIPKSKKEIHSERDKVTEVQLGYKTEKKQVLHDTFELDPLNFNRMTSQDGSTIISNVAKQSLKDNIENFKIYSSDNFDSDQENIDSKNPIAKKVKFFQESLSDKENRGGKVKSSALKNFSSKINVENSNRKKKKLKVHGAVLDDLSASHLSYSIYSPKIVKKGKCKNLINDAEFIFANKNQTPKNIHSEASEIKGTSTNVLNKNIAISTTEKTLQPEEIIKNLAKNTILVTAEIHKTPENDDYTKKKPFNTDKLHPIVLVQDIFKANKSFCKSISCSSKVNDIPLEMQLIHHCSSLKVIPEESTEASSHSNKNSKSKNLVESVRSDDAQKELMEPFLSVEGEIKDFSDDEKRKFRRRTTINYREPSINRKLRRGNQ